MDLLPVNTMVRLFEGSTALTRIEFKKNALSKTYDRGVFLLSLGS